MNFVPSAKFPLTQDVSGLRNHLINEKILHRFTEEGNYQILWVIEDVPVEKIHNLIQNAESLGVSARNSEDHAAVASKSFGLNEIVKNVFLGCISYPITYLTLLLGIIGYATINLFQFNTFNSLLYFGSLSHILVTGETWRLITPTFLHFGFLHILFNGLWIYVLGIQLERYLKIKSYLLLFFGTALFANLLQILLGKSAYFGGLSGVVYGYFGFMWMAGNYLKVSELRIQNSLFGMILFFLLLGFSGILTKVFSVGIANWAHLGGLIAGCVLPFLLIDKKRIEHEH